MTEGRKQFAVYRLKHGNGELEALRHRSWEFIQRYHIRVDSDHYDQLCIVPFIWDMDLMDLRRQLEAGLPAAFEKERLEVSDVLVITREGVTTAYYVDIQKLVVLQGFFHMTGSAALLTIDTENYQIEGRLGNWMAADEIWIEGRHFFLMRSQQFGENAKFAVLDSQGKQAAPDTSEGFSEEVIRQIREYIHTSQQPYQTTSRPSGTPMLENWQKSFENGEYLRTAEMAEEQNYSMIDGRMNNMPPKLLVRERPKRKRRKGKLPLKGRESVLKRLKEYQELSRQGGKTLINQETPDLQERKKM